MPLDQLTEADIGRFVTYTPYAGCLESDKERGKVKRFDNERRVAWVVYNCNNNWDGDHWKDYTAACASYEDLS